MGDRVWRLQIKSQGAKSLNFIFSKFYMPQGGEFFIYNEDQTYLIGAFTTINNKSHGGFSTAPVKGSTVILEYYEPLAVKGQGAIAVSSIIHAYRDMFATAQSLNKDFGDSGNCNIDVNCPASAGWEDEIRSVAMIITSGNTRWCSGAMVNNTAEDKTPYYLTANHCLDGNENNWIFVFNYQSPTCNGPDGSLLESVSGSTTKATHNPSDMALLELSVPVPDAYNVHFSGWDNTNTAATSSVGIHHPAGDVKKISFDTDPLTTQGANFWRVGNWEQGTTEGGSSGSPLYNQNHHIVGQLQGGAASCFNISYDDYGKVYTSWLGGGTTGSQLMAWLDPLNLGVTSLDGNSFTCGATGLAATSDTNSAILTWNANIDTITNFDIRYRTVGGSGWTMISISDTLTTVTLVGLLPCTDYEFQVNMDCDSVWSGFSNSFAFTTDGCCEPPTNFVITNLTDTTATITGGTVTAALSYDMQYREQGTTNWTLVSGLSAPTYNFTGLTPCTVYEVEFRTNCIGATTPFGSTFTFNSGCGQCMTLPYCASQGYSVVDEWIEEVILNTINNNSGVATSGYTDFTTITTSLTAEQTYNISLSQGYAGSIYNEHFNVWIDFDQSGTFDGSELVYSSGTTTTFPNTGTVTIPASALLGGTRMRVSMKFNSGATSCESFQYGEVEDYCVTIVGGSTTPCSAPANLQSSNVTTSDATVSWSSATGANTYRVRYREVGAGNWQFVNAVPTTSTTLTGLSDCTDYEFEVRSNCSGGVNSGYSSTTTFMTACVCDDVTDLDTVVVSDNAATLTWSSVNNAVVYNIEYKISSASSWTTTAPTTNTTYQVNNLQPATFYDARLRVACPNNTFSNYSNIVSFYTDWTTNTNSLPTDIQRFEAYPNPFENHINLIINSIEAQDITIQLFNIEGKIIQSEVQQISEGLNTLNISTEQFATGMYILRLVTENGVVSRRVLKE